MSANILAYDLGTTGNKVTMFSERGQIRASVFAGYETFYPQPGWAEQDPEDWWRSACEATQQLIAGGVNASEIDAISFSGQMMGCIPVDRNGAVLHRSLIHADARSIKQCERLQAELGAAEIYRLTGNRIAPQYTLPKIAWMREHRPEVFANTALFLQAKDWLAYKSCGELGVTDYSDASLTGLMDIGRKQWSKALLHAVGISESRLPRVVASSTVVGRVTAEAARLTGLKQGTPVAIGGGDGACAAVGAGALEPGEAYNYGGGTSWVSVVTEQPVIDPQMRVFNLIDLDPRKTNTLGTVQSAGSTYKWFADEIGALETAEAEHDGTDRFERLNDMARQIGPGSQHLFFLPYLMGERTPIWDANARGVFFGITLSHTRAHLCRAVLEGVVYALRSVVEALESLGQPVTSLALIGGMAKGDVFRQILATCLDKTLWLPSHPGEATSRGAAVAGAVGIGALASFEDARGWIAETGRVEPQPEHVAAYDAYFRFYQSLYPALEDKFKQAVRLP